MRHAIRGSRRAAGLVLLACLVGPAANAQVHRCVDANGRTEYRSAACDSGTRGQALPIGEERARSPDTPAPSTTARGERTAPPPPAAPPPAPRDLPAPGFGSPVAPRDPTTPRFGSPVAPLNEREQPLLREAPPRSLATDAELVVVSGYEGSPGVTRVRLNRPGKRVLLVLSSYDKILWRVEPGPRTTISGVVLASHGDESRVVADIPMPVHLVKLPYAYDTDNIKFRSLLGQLNRWFGVEKIDAVRGEYKLPPVVEIVAPTPGRPELTLQGVAATAPASVFDFDLLTRDYRKAGFRNDGTSTTPRQELNLLAGSQTALSGSGRYVYVLTGSGLQETDIESGVRTPVPVPTDFPSFSWATAVAYDSHQDIVTVVTLGGEGFLYRYDTRRKRWLDYRSLNNVDITSLAYDPQARRYVAWTSDGRLLTISNSGEALGSKALKSMLPGFGTLYDGGNGSPPALILAPRSPNVALVHLQGGAVAMIWTYDEKTGQARLTYKRAGTQQRTPPL